jgi:hypothetical protein
MLDNLRNKLLAPDDAPAESNDGGATPFDGVDLMALLVGGAALYEIAHPLPIILAGVQYVLRRYPATARWLAEAIFGERYDPAKASHWLPGLPADERPLLPEPVIEEAPKPAVKPKKGLPRLVLLEDMTVPSSSTAVPLGRNEKGEEVWADLATDLLHTGIYGTSGAGKDTLLRVWFSLLTERNSPAQLQWAFLDGKGDWLTPDLAELACMFIAPAGGYGQKGKEAIRTAIARIDEEAERRQSLIFPNGCRTREQYNAKAVTAGWEPLPLLVVVVSDVMDSVAGEVEDLLSSLVSKARALGIRVIASMQTPTGKSMEWRMNLSSVLAGALVDGSQDAPALGVREVRNLPYRPSQLEPPPKEKGLFVAKVRGQFHLVRTPIFTSGDNEGAFNAKVVALSKKTFQAVTKACEVSAESDGKGEPETLLLETPPESQRKAFPAPSQPVSDRLDEIREAAQLWRSEAGDEKRKAIAVLRKLATGAGKQAAITEVYGHSSGRNYQRASRLVEAARVLAQARKQ